MTDARAFLGRRVPPPPEALDRVLATLDMDGIAPREGLLREGLDALDRARRAPGRVRESAFHLLAADALLTYACEAALEEDDPEATLSELVRSAGERR